VNQKAIEVQLASQQTKIDQAKALLDALSKTDAAALEVRAGISGELAPLATPLQVGQHVTAGTSVAKVIQLDKLKAASPDRRNPGARHPDRPAGLHRHAQRHHSGARYKNRSFAVLNGTRTVDVALDGPLPPGAVPQLSVDGTIDLEQDDRTCSMWDGRRWATKTQR
jgi:HlyD family secretion protein